MPASCSSGSEEGVTDFSEMTDLRLSLRQTLSENAVI